MSTFLVELHQDDVLEVLLVVGSERRKKKTSYKSLKSMIWKQKNNEKSYRSYRTSLRKL